MKKLNYYFLPWLFLGSLTVYSSQQTETISLMHLSTNQRIILQHVFGDFKDIAQDYERIAAICDYESSCDWHAQFEESFVQRTLDDSLENEGIQARSAHAIYAYLDGKIIGGMVYYAIAQCVKKRVSLVICIMNVFCESAYVRAVLKGAAHLVYRDFPKAEYWLISLDKRDSDYSDFSELFRNIHFKKTRHYCPHVYQQDVGYTSLMKLITDDN